MISFSIFFSLGFSGHIDGCVAARRHHYAERETPLPAFLPADACLAETGRRRVQQKTTRDVPRWLVRAALSNFWECNLNTLSHVSFGIAIQKLYNESTLLEIFPISRTRHQIIDIITTKLYPVDEFQRNMKQPGWMWSMSWRTSSIWSCSGEM